MHSAGSNSSTGGNTGEVGGGNCKAAVAAGAFEDSAASTVATYNCPVCRKAHVLDLDRLQVIYILPSGAWNLEDPG